MKKIFVISFLLTFLCSNTEICQLLKLPNLIHHYFEHEKKDSSISFVDFLNIHYNKNINHSDNKNEHGHLPFKSACSHSVNTVFHLQTQSLVFIRKVVLIPSKIIIFFCQQFYTSHDLACIWLPPKFS